MFSCLCDINPPSSWYPFSSIPQGDHYGDNPQLIQDWKQLQAKLLTLHTILHINPVPGPTLFELQYPLPSTFGYIWMHHHWGVADTILECSGNAFYHLMARVSYLLFFLNLPAIHGPLLHWNVHSSALWLYQWLWPDSDYVHTIL